MKTKKSASAMNCAWTSVGLALASLWGCSATAVESDQQSEELVELDTAESPLFYTQPGACAEYEAENIGRAGGAPASGGWKLTNAGDNINVNRLFVSGSHSFGIVARGTAGGGQKPQIKLTLNGVQIGGNITVTNTAITDGWSQYVVHYNVTTGNNKLIKVELANPGSGRALILDGINLYCPQQGVVCGEDGECGNSSCCQNTEADALSCQDSCDGRLAAPVWCDQPSDCAGNGVCRIAGNPFNGFGVGCSGTSNLPSPSANPFNREICKSPNYPEWTCSQGGTCADMGPSWTGWKYCM